jgi:hypothetical protein
MRGLAYRGGDAGGRDGCNCRYHFAAIFAFRASVCRLCGGVVRQAIKAGVALSRSALHQISPPRGVLGFSGFKAPNTPIACLAPSIPAFDDISKTLEQRRTPGLETAT